MENIMLPVALSSSISSERKDFAVKADRAQPLKKSFSLIILGTILTGFMSMFIFAFLGPLFVGKEVHFKTNGVPTIASLDNLGPIIMPAIIIGVFTLIGIGLLFFGIFSIFKKGGYFVGTPSRLVHYQNGNIRSIDWEQFSGNITVNSTSQKGNISLQMRTGKTVSRKNGPDKYVPEVIYMCSIPNAHEVEKICRKRIKENDPTPSFSQN